MANGKTIALIMLVFVVTEILLSFTIIILSMMVIAFFSLLLQYITFLKPRTPLD